MKEKSLLYAFDILKVDKVTLGVFENNESAYDSKEEQKKYGVVAFKIERI